MCDQVCVGWVGGPVMERGMERGRQVGGKTEYRRQSRVVLYLVMIVKQTWRHRGGGETAITEPGGPSDFSFYYHTSRVREGPLLVCNVSVFVSHLRSEECFVCLLSLSVTVCHWGFCS